MHDIDFDELDKAVHSAISAGGKDAKPEHAELLETGADEEVAEEHARMKKVSPAVRRSSGRFMDVVHPSSDMRTKGKKAKPVVKKAEPEKVEPAETPEPVEKTEPKPEKHDKHAAAFHEHKTHKKGHKKDADDDEAPLESPFLPDTKVEKRPLGAPAAVSAPGKTLEEIEKDDLEKSEETLLGLSDTADTAPGKPPVEEEVPEIVETTKVVPKEEQAEPVETPAPEADAEKKDDTPAPSETTEPPAEPEKKPESEPKTDDSPAPLESTSIQQQYKESKTDDNDKSGAIYDTESYHQPLMFTRTKRSGLKITLWILGLIIFGGALGAGVYFYVLPML